jgi:short-subunit dehydrogenase
MSVQLKPLNEQVIVITGATSGIGLVTARMAAKRGAKLVLCARNQTALQELVAELNASGAEAIDLVADVGRLEEVEHLASEALRHFGRIDTWINNAGVSIYGRVFEVPLDDQRQLFETNYWGLVHGSLVAARHLRARGGAIINLGSALSDRSIPLQGIYCASKHAVKGFTDALRMELEKEGALISVTLIKPAAIDTPYRQHARNYLAVEPLNPPPVYAPRTVASAILHCAQHSRRDVYVGAASRAIALAGALLPGMTDWVMKALFFRLQKTNERASSVRRDSLYAPSDDGGERGGYPGYVVRTSAYTAAVLHPVAAMGLLATGITMGLLLMADQSCRRA